MRYCLHPIHSEPSSLWSPWILDDEPDHQHVKLRVRYKDGYWQPIDAAIKAGMEALKND